jgi:diguanylate cyclase (GGDEF)-like protein
MVEWSRDLVEWSRLLASGALGPLTPAQRRTARHVETDAAALLAASAQLLSLQDLDPPAPPVPSGRADPTAVPAPGRPRLLIADSDPDDREAISAALHHDYDVATCGGGPEALASAHQDPPDLLLLSLQMPALDGLAVLEALRAEARPSELPVILLAGHADDATRVRALELGAADVLQKPVSLRELRARIERTLRLSRRHTQLRTLAQTDPLTGLANLRAFRARLDDEVRRALRYRTPLACVMADMDQLKPVNDEHGHAAGDRAIAAVADVIRAELRATDLGARCGGDEFVLLLPHTTSAEAQVLAERLCARLRESPLEVEGRSIPLRASFGVAELGAGPPSESATDLVRRADAALYAAKRAGGSRAAVQTAATSLALDS